MKDDADRFYGVQKDLPGLRRSALPDHLARGQQLEVNAGLDKPIRLGSNFGFTAVEGRQLWRDADDLILALKTEEDVLAVAAGIRIFRTIQEALRRTTHREVKL